MLPSEPPDRARRLADALPHVSEALRQPKVFNEDQAKIWNDLRRGLTDLKKDLTALETMRVPDGSINDVWEFILTLMVTSPKYSRQLLDAVSILLTSERWVAGFMSSQGKGRLSLWKLSAGGGAGPSPVELTMRLLQLGAPVDELMPASEVMGQASAFVEELFANAGQEERMKLECSELGLAWREDQLARTRADAPTPSVADEGDKDLGVLTKANQAEAASIEAAGKQDKRPGCRKDVVDSLLDVTTEALDCAAACLKPMLSGYTGEQNIAESAKSKLLEFRQRQANLQAQLVVLGPCQAGKTSLTYALVGFAALPPATPSMVTTRWVHTSGLAIPRLTMPEALAELLQMWAERVRAVERQAGCDDLPISAGPLGQTVEGVDNVAETLERIHLTVHRGRRLGVIRPQELEKLCRPIMSVSVEVAFTALSSLEDALADTGRLSIVDLPSPDGDLLWERQDIANLLKRSLQEADGVLVVVDASKHEVPRWLGDLLRDAFVQERLLRREDAWIVANRIDQLPDFYCQDGITTVCRKVKELQHRNYPDVIVGEDHVIPTAARLSLLALYGLRQVTAQLSPNVLASLSKQAWFAWVCAFLFGVHWPKQVRMMEWTKWKQSMRELQLFGQVTGQLASSVLQTAYVKMLPRSVARVMFDLSQLITNIVGSLRVLEGGGASIDSEQLKLVFQTFYEDVQRRVLGRLRQGVPSEANVRQWAAAKCGASVVFDDADSSELNEKYFALLAREALGLWQQSFTQGAAQCCEEATKAHQKWQRSIDHYLMQGGVDAATKQKVLVDSKNLRLVTGAEGVCPLESAERDRLVIEHASKVSVTKRKQLFQRTRKTYLITPDNVVTFLLELSQSWNQSAEKEIIRRCLDPILKNYDDMIQNIEELNTHRLAGAMRPEVRQTFDFSWAHRLAEVLPRVAAFNPQEDSSDAIEADEADRCSKFCNEVRAVLRDIEKARQAKGW